MRAGPAILTHKNNVLSKNVTPGCLEQPGVFIAKLLGIQNGR